MTQHNTVLQITRTLSIGGTERTAQCFSSHLKRLGFDVIVCATLAGGPREAVLREKQIEYYVANGDYGFLEELARTKGVTIAHIHRGGTPDVEMLRAVVNAGVPVIVQSSHFGRPLTALESQHTDMTYHVSMTSAFRYKCWMKLSDAHFLDRCKVLYNPIDLKEIDTNRPEKQDVDTLRSKLNIPLDFKIIGQIGHDQCGKWDTTPYNVMLRVHKHISNVMYLYVGCPPAERAKIAASPLAAYFKFVESTADPRVLMLHYHAMELLAHSSSCGETFGMVIAEGMANGKPVVTLANPLRGNAQAELVANGVTGFVTQNVDDYARAVICLLNDKSRSREMGAAGRKKVERLYSSETVVEALARSYIELLHKKGLQPTIDRLPGGSDRDKEAHLRDADLGADVVAGLKTVYRRGVEDCFGKRKFFQPHLAKTVATSYRAYALGAQVKRAWRRLSSGTYSN